MSSRRWRMLGGFVVLVAILLLAAPWTSKSASPAADGLSVAAPADPAPRIYGAATVLPDSASVAPGATLAQILCPPGSSLSQALQHNGLLSDTSEQLATLACGLNVLDFKFVTVYRAPNGSLTKHEQAALINVPSLIDVNGDHVPDVTATVIAVNFSQLTLRVNRLPSLGPLPMSIEAVFTDPSNAQRQVGFGYDATHATSAPQSFVETVNLSNAQQIGFALTTNSPGDQLALTGELFTPGPLGTKVNPLAARLNYRPVPGTFGVTVGLSTPQTVQLTTVSPTRLDAFLQLVSGPSEQRVAATIDQLPARVNLSLDQSSGGGRTVTYDAASTVNAIDVTYQALTGGSQTLLAKASLRQLPTHITITQEPSTESLSASAPIGTVEGSIVNGVGSALTLTDDQYVRRNIGAATDSTAFRIQGLSNAVVNPADPLDIQLKSVGGPFRFLIEKGPRTIDGTVTNLPNTLVQALHFRLDAHAGTVGYDGPQGIANVHVDGRDPTFFVGRADHAILDLQQIPASFALAYAITRVINVIDGSTSESLSVNMPNPIGIATVIATNGPVPVFVTTSDQAIFHDMVGGEYLAAVHVTQLQSVTAQQTPLELDVVRQGSPRVFAIDYRQQKDVAKPPKVATATIDKLPLEVHLHETTEAGGGSHYTYTASSSIDSIQLDAYNFKLPKTATELHATLLAIPTAVTVELPQTGPITVDAPGGVGEITLTLSDGRTPTPAFAAGTDGVFYHNIERVGAGGTVPPRDAHFGAELQVYDLQHVSFQQDPLAIAATHGGALRSLAVDVEGYPASAFWPMLLTATIEQLPASISLIQSDAGVFYSASSNIPRLELHVQKLDKKAFVGTANHLDLVATDIPGFVFATFANGSGLATTGNVPIGVIDLSLSNNPQGFLGITGSSSVLIQKLSTPLAGDPLGPNYYALTAHLEGLRGFTTDTPDDTPANPQANPPTPKVVSPKTYTLDAGNGGVGALPFSIDVLTQDPIAPCIGGDFTKCQQNPSEIDETTASISNLQRHTSVTIEEPYDVRHFDPKQFGDARKVTYSADADAAQLHFHTNSGMHTKGVDPLVVSSDPEKHNPNRGFIDATLTPLPKSLSICQSRNDACSWTGLGAQGLRTPVNGVLITPTDPRIDFHASSPTTVDFTDCITPNANLSQAFSDLFCYETLPNGSGGIWQTLFHVQLTLQDLQFESATNTDQLILYGWIGLNTNNNQVTGHLLYNTHDYLGDTGDVQQVRATFPHNFRADHRIVFFFNDNPITYSGTINCPPGINVQADLNNLPHSAGDFSGNYLCNSKLGGITTNP